MNPLTATFALAAASVVGIVLDLPGLHVMSTLAGCITVVIAAHRMDVEVAE